MAKELNAWVEQVFLDKIPGFELAEGIREQLWWYSCHAGVVLYLFDFVQDRQ